MPYCINCGARIEEGCNFCMNCGTPVKNEIYEEKRQVFAGKVVKCPNCGTQIANSYVTKCPGCGFELGTTKISNALSKFEAGIENFDNKIAEVKVGYSTWNIFKKIGWIMLCVYTVGICQLVYSLKHKEENKRRSAYEAQKKNYIEKYILPNDKTSLLDALIFIKDRLYSITKNTVKGEDYKWAKIWINKEELIYQKIQMLFPDDEFATKVYNESRIYYKKIRQLRVKRILIITVTVIVITCFCMLVPSVES